MLKLILNNKLSISLFKWLIILFLINLFVIDPIIKGVTKAINGASDKMVVKIISLDLLSNPLTFIQLAKNAIENNKIENAELYIRYAEVLDARYSYPPSLKKSIASINAKISEYKKRN